MTSGATRIGLLGPLEIRRDGAPAVTVGGAKQRTLLGALLLEAGHVISTDLLVEELWEEEPPPSAAHTLEAMVSRLRRVLGPFEVGVHRSGAGYVVDVGDAALDVREFQQAERTSRAALLERPDNAAILGARTALALWRGPVLDDLPLGPRGRAVSAGLEEERLRLLELVLDAELACGRHAEALPELQATAGLHPFRERFVALLMLALYRCGRHADALAVYERTRVALDAQLGLQPGPELQRLSARIVRHDPTLDVSPPAPRARPAPEPVEAARRRRSPVAVLAAAVAVATLSVGAGGGGALPAPLESTGKVALVLPRAPAGRPPDLMARLQEEARLATVRGDVELDLETVVLDDVAPEQGALGRFAEQLRRGAFELVVWFEDGAAAEALAPLVAALPSTTFVYVDGSLDEIGLDGVRNASAIRFAKEEVSDLTGYLAGLVAPMGAAPTARVDTVGIVAGPPTRDTLRLVRRFRRGLEDARPSADVLVGHVPAGDERLPCETLANRQIDAGADVVVSLAGRCGLGALAVARVRNVWGIADDEAEQMSAAQRDGLLAHMSSDVEVAVGEAIDRFVYGTLPSGTTEVRGLEENYAVAMWFNDAIPEAAASRTVERCSAIREHSRHDPSRSA